MTARTPSRLAVHATGETHTRSFETMAWTVAALLALAYVAFIVQLTSFPFQDYPNHVARGAIIADLLFRGGERFGHLFEVQLAFVPYILHDLVLATCIALFGTNVGAGVFTTLVLLSLPAALLFYLHVMGIAPRAWLTVFLLSLFLATDWFFLMAFMGFRLAVAFVLVSLALVELLRRRLAAPLFATYAGVLVAGYFTHLTSIVFFAPVLAVSAAARLAFRSSTLRRELLLFLPLVALLLLHFLVIDPQNGAASRAYPDNWGDIHRKLDGLFYELIRYGERPSRSMALALLVCVLWPVRREILRWRLITRPAVIEPLLVAIAFFGIYIVLPRDYADSSYVDVRALALVTLFGMLACVQLSNEGSGGRGFATLPVRALAALLAIVNLGYLMTHMGANDAWISRFREVVRAVPPGTAVLPVYTQEKQRYLSPMLHAGSFLVLDRQALMPYLFSLERGDPMKYFRYRDRPYMPHENWYRAQVNWDSATEASFEVLGRLYTWRFRFSGRDDRWDMVGLIPVDWTRVACHYDMVLVQKPFEERFIGVPTTRTIAENDTAVLREVDSQSCRRGPPPRRKVRLPLEY